MKKYFPFSRNVICSLVTFFSIFLFFVSQVVYSQAKKTGVKTHSVTKLKNEILPSTLLKLKDIPIGKTSQMRLEKALESTYFIYSFWPDSSIRDYWDGVMIMPDPSEVDSKQELVGFDKVDFDKNGDLRIVKASKSANRNASFWGYQSADTSSLSQYINNGERNIGLLQLVKGNIIRLIVDLDNDRVIDYELELDVANKRVNVFLSNNRNALIFSDELMTLSNVLCRANLSNQNLFRQSAAGNSMPVFGMGAEPKSLINMCGSSRGQSNSGGSSSGKAAYDPVKDYCRKILSNKGNLSGIRSDPPSDPTHGDGDVGTGDNIIAAVDNLRTATKDFATAVGGGDLGNFVNGAVSQVSVFGFFLTTVRNVGQIADHWDNNDRPIDGGEGYNPGINESDFMKTYCQSKTGNHPGPPTIEEIEKSLKAKECPNPAESGTGSNTGVNQNTPGGVGGDSKLVIPPTYGDPTGKNCVKPKHYQTFSDMMEGVSKRRCKPNERPDANGNCGNSSVSRTFDTNRGKAAIAFGEILGIHFCDPKFCDPAKFSNQQLLRNKPKKVN